MLSAMSTDAIARAINCEVSSELIFDALLMSMSLLDDQLTFLIFYVFSGVVILEGSCVHWGRMSPPILRKTVTICTRMKRKRKMEERKGSDLPRQSQPTRYPERTNT